MSDSKQIIDRWYVDDDYIIKRNNIVKDLKRGRNVFAKDKGGFFDIKGIHIVDQEKIERDELFNIKPNKFLKIDFSYSDFSNTYWKNCEFIECKFDNVVFFNVTFVNCTFRNLVFINCKFKHCNLAKNNYRDSGAFVNVQFEKSTLKYVDFCFPLIDLCTFTNCKIDKVDFDGSRFSNSSFIGEVESASFRGYSKLAGTRLFGVFTKFDPKKYKNKMVNVDFSAAELRYVGFYDEICLIGCKFPSGDNYLSIKNPKNCYDNVRNIIQQTWPIPEKKEALAIIDLLDFGDSKVNMSMDFISKSPIAKVSKSLQNKVYSLLQKESEEYMES